MEDILGLLKTKLSRIAENRDEAELAFVTTLLTSDGYVDKQKDYSFSYYHRLRCENIFQEVKQRLLAEGVIQENDDTLHINCPRWNMLNDRERKQVVRELSAFLFDKGRDYYLKILRRVTSAQEQYFKEWLHILDGLVKVGSSISDGTVGHLRQYAGHKPYQEFEEIMGGAGLFIHRWSSNKHDYYCLFEPLINAFIQTPYDALAFVYIAQHIRPDRAGVLNQDCREYEREFLPLLSKGLVEERSWKGTSLRGYVTTDRGRDDAIAIIKERLKQAENSMKSLLDTIPSKFLQFFWKELIEPNSANNVGDGWTVNRSEGFRDNFNNSNLCLLNDSKVKELRDIIMNTLVNKGLAAKAYSYVSSKGGRVDDLTFVPAPEVVPFFRDYMTAKSLLSDKPIFDEELERKHKLYHVLLHFINSPTYLPNKEGWYIYGQSNNVDMQDIKDATERFIKKGLLKEEGDRYIVVSSEACKKTIEQEFFLPLVEDLLKSTQIIPAPSKEQKEIFKIRAIYKGKTYDAEFNKKDRSVYFEDEKIFPKRKSSSALSAAAEFITKTPVNGWKFWEYYDEKSRTWKLIDELRKAVPDKEKTKQEQEEKPEKAITPHEIEHLQYPTLPLNGIKKSLLECFLPPAIHKDISHEFLSGLEKRLREILSEFNIPCDVDRHDFDIGPRLVRANIKLGKGEKISKLTKISEDIANKLFSDKALFAFERDDEVPRNVLIESVPAKGAVGIYLPRSKFTPVGIQEILQAFPSNNTLNFSIGKNIVGENQYSNLEEMPHLLIGGHTGSGKSVFLNSLIVGLIFQNSPKDLGLILIDPKGGLEFGSYESLSFLKYDSIIDSPEEAEEVLRTVVEEMEKRYRIFKEEKVKKLSEFNSKNKDGLPYLVIIIDEFADIILNEKGKTRKELASLVQKLAQKGRAAGVHIIIATQKPVNECFPTIIKGNIPARIAFRVTKSEESNVILGETGAETLFGKGDMLVKDPGMGNLRRFQAPYIKNEEIECFVAKVKNLWE